MNPDYNSEDPMIFYNADIALLRLRTPVPATMAKPIPINCNAAIPALGQRVAYVPA
jgi:hypothetical protein